MIAGQIFKNFQDMHQRAVKVARVLEETKRENRAANFGKRKLEVGNRGPSGGDTKQFNAGRPHDKGK